MSRFEHACALLALSLAVSPVVAADEPEAKPPAADGEAGAPAAKPEAEPPASSASAPAATEATPPAEGAAAAATSATSVEEWVPAPPPVEGGAATPPPEHAPSSEVLPRSGLGPPSGSSHLLVTGIAMLGIGTVVTVTAAVETANAGTLHDEGMETASLVVLAAGGAVLILGIPVTLAGYSVWTSEEASAWAPTLTVGPSSCDLLWSF
jgi:hypothetical protein